MKLPEALFAGIKENCEAVLELIENIFPTNSTPENASILNSARQFPCISNQTRLNFQAHRQASETVCYGQLTGLHYLVFLNMVLRNYSAIGVIAYTKDKATKILYSLEKI